MTTSPDPMRIGIVASSSHPVSPPFAGGLERHTWMLASGLAERGHDVTVFAGEGTHGDGFDVRTIGPSQPLRISETARRDVSMLSEGFLVQHHAYLGLLLELQEQEEWDVVHNNSLHHLPVAMAPSLPAASTMTLHCPPTPWLESALRLTPTPPRCIAVSHDTAQRWEHAVASEVVHNAIDLATWPVGPGGSGRAVWTGRLVPEKGPHLALEAAVSAGLPLDLAGPVGDDEYVRDEVLPRLRSCDRLLGHLDGEELSSVVGAAEVQLVTPCWDEPYGLVVPEALATGTPVAAFDRGAMPELLDERTGVLATPDDPEDLARAALAARQLDRGDCRAHAERIASADRMLDEYEQVFAAVAA